MEENDQIKINEPVHEKIKAIKAASDHLPSIKHLYPYKYTQLKDISKFSVSQGSDSPNSEKASHRITSENYETKGKSKFTPATVIVGAYDQKCRKFSENPSPKLRKCSLQDEGLGKWKTEDERHEKHIIPMILSKEEQSQIGFSPSLNHNFKMFFDSQYTTVGKQLFHVKKKAALEFDTVVGYKNYIKSTKGNM